MRTQSRFSGPRFGVTPGAIGWGCILALLVYVPLAIATNDAKRAQNPPCPPAGQTNQNSAPAVIPPLPEALPEAVLNTELMAINRSTFKLADYRGKVVLVNLWATWCGPCRMEIPNLVSVNREFKAKDVEVIGLTSEDPKSDRLKVKAFVREYKITYKIGWGDQSFVLALMQDQVRNNIPQTFVISRDGRVLKRFIGFSQTETPRKLRQAVEDALNAK